MVDASSKRALSAWYKDTAIQRIRLVDVEELNSQRYRDKWDQVNEKDILEIGRRFFRKLANLEAPSPDSLLFVTTNYFTFMASDTESGLCKRSNSTFAEHKNM